MASCGRHEVASGSEDGEADRHDPAVQAVMEERQRQRERDKAAGSASASAAAAPPPATPDAAVVVVPAPLPTSTAEQRAEAERMRAGAAARTRPSGWFHAQEQRRVVLAASAADADGSNAENGAKRRQHLWASQNAAATGATMPEQQDDTSAAATITATRSSPLPQCKKCKAAPAVALLRQNEPLCGACASEGVLGKARASLRGGRLRAGDRVLVALSGGYGSLGMLRALLQLRAPGGARATRPERGRVAFDLECVHVRESALEWLPLAPAGVVVSGGATPVDCSNSSSDWLRDPAVAAARARAERRAEGLERALAEAATALGYEGEVTVVRLEDVFDDEFDGGGGGGGATNDDNSSSNLARLCRLLSSARDRTAREDLADSLRERLLRRFTLASGCNALALGDTAGTVAVRVIAGAAKGRLFSVPGDVAPVAVVEAEGAGGSRGNGGGGDASPSSSSSLVVLRPVRDVTAAELAVSFRHASGSARSPEEEEQVVAAGEEDTEQAAAAALRSSWSSGGSRRAPASLNALTRGFVSAIEAHMPASIYAVLRSAGALQAFPFNEDAALVPLAASGAPGASGARRHKGREEQQQAEAGTAADPITRVPRCRICSSPLLPAEQEQEGEGAPAPWPPGSLGALDGGGAQGVCYCCERQVLDLMISDDDDDEDGEAGEAEKKEDQAADATAAAALPGEAERRARRARRRRQLARLRAMLPPDDLEEC